MNMGRLDYVDYIDKVTEVYPLDNNQLVISKVVQGNEKGNKNRVVCIQNFWIQQLMGDIQSVVAGAIQVYERHNSCH
jgi:hypothetical protein